MGEKKVVRTFVIKNLAGVAVHPILNALDVLFAVVLYRRSLGYKTPNHHIGVLIGAALPSGIGMTIVNLCPLCF